MNTQKGAGWLQDDSGNNSSGRAIAVLLVLVGIGFMAASVALNDKKAEKASEAGYYCIGVGVFGRIAGKGVEKIGRNSPQVKPEELP